MTTLIIDGRLDGLNNFIAVSRTPRIGATLSAKMKRENQERIAAHIEEQIPHIHYVAPVRLHFKWYEPNRRRDLDNICFAKKFILDALVEHGVIPNDNQQYVRGFTDEFYVDNDNPRVEVTIDYAEEMLPI